MVRQFEGNGRAEIYFSKRRRMGDPGTLDDMVVLWTPSMVMAFGRFVVKP